MSKLLKELQRLYFLPDQHWLSQQPDADGKLCYAPKRELTPAVVADAWRGEACVALDLVSSDGMVRTMVMNFAKAGDWERVANFYQRVQDELDLPAPAVSVSGQQGYGLWFSLAEPVPVVQADLFFTALRGKYLVDGSGNNLEVGPDVVGRAATQSVASLPPSLHLLTGKWSAFIDPSLGSMFVDEPGLEMAPNMDRQADILAGLESIQAGDFERALRMLQTPAAPESDGDLAAPPSSGCLHETLSQSTPDTGGMRSRLNVGSHYGDPQSFLLAVMNDSSASAGQRIKAAKALLPYFAGSKPE